MKRNRSDKTIIFFLGMTVFLILLCFCFRIHALGEEKDINPPEIKVEITDAGKEFTSNVRKATIIITDDKMKGEIKKEYVFKEGKDSFHISIKDAAGNESIYRSDVYVQDYTAPLEKTEGISDGQIINEELDVRIFAIEEWLDEEKSFVTITGQNSYDEYKYFFEENNISIYDDGSFKDDCYSMRIFLSDKAGNTCERNIDFTINRDGSLFEVDKRNKEIIGSVTDDIKDFYILEKNLSRVDTDNARILFAFNARAVDLKIGRDYRIEEKKDADGYTYTYIFHDELFKKDGIYTISLSTRDEAGNVNDTRLSKESDEIRFAVKKRLRLQK
ncbi:MAG: hypothetical protein J6X97_04180 [Lachnospiraceae bacterium]|nr:hypothetical protein [Lachnospiraceae bacterium]